MACLTQNARAYEYTFDLQEMGKNVYQEAELLQDGISIYIHTDGDVAPNIYAWNSDGDLTTGFPGTKMELLRVVDVKNDGNNKKSYYRIDFVGEDDVRFIVNFNGDQDKSKDIYLIGKGSYFFDYDGTQGTMLHQETKYYTGSTNQNPQNVNIYVQVKNSDITPTIYYYNQWGHEFDWNNQPELERIDLFGQTWFKKTIDYQKVNGGGVIFSDHGNNATQTANIKNITGNGDYYYYYYPNGTGDRYETVNVVQGGKTNNYDEWTYNPFWTVNGSIVTFSTTNERGEKATVKIQCPNPEAASAFRFVDGKYIVVRAGSTFTFETEAQQPLNEVYLGTVRKADGSGDDINFYPVGQNGYTQTDISGFFDFNGPGSTDNYFVAGISKDFAPGSTSYTCGIKKTWDGDKDEYRFGPQFVIRDERFTCEELTFADHNVVGQYHSIIDDLIGVQVVEVGPTKTSYLICQSVNPISDVHKHKQGNQEIWKDSQGNTPSYANPETPQYAWIGLKLENPEQYINKKISNVRGLFVPDAVNGTFPNASFGSSDNERYYNYKFFNPIMQVVGTPEIGDDATPVINTYSVANLYEQDKTSVIKFKDTNEEYTPKYFFMEPRPFEIANIVDVMRTDDQVIWAPKENAILSEGRTVNEYDIAGIKGWAGITDPCIDMWKENDKHLFGDNYQQWGWMLRDKVYKVPNALLLLMDYQPNTNPLDQPNREYYTYSSDKALGFHIQGKAELAEYKQEMVVGQGDYWSRYEYKDDRNAYRNDLEITIYKPTENLASIGNMYVQRIDANGDAKNIAYIEQNQHTPSQFTISYLDEENLQTARNDEKLAEVALDFNKAPFEAGNVDLKASNIGVSDMFYSPIMSNYDANANLSESYSYKVVRASGEEDPNFSVVSKAPVYKTNKNVVTRATYTKDQVDNDIDNGLTPIDKAEVTFTPNTEFGMTQYRVYKADVNADEGGKKWEVALANIKVDDDGFLNPTFTDDDITGETYEYVPEVYTAYNNNTYGCYKQIVSDASVEMNVKSIVAADFTNDENGTRYIHAAIDLSSVIKNTDKDSRYLLRVWRQVGNGEKVLLNDQEEAWETNYGELQYTGLNEDTFAKTNPNNPFTLYDTFEAVTSKPSAAPGLKAYGDMVNIEDVKYTVALYVKDDASGKYYVKTDEITPATSIPTAISTVNANAQVESVRYYNVSGIESSKPFAGMNIVVTRYTDGSSRITKLVK